MIDVGGFLLHIFALHFCFVTSKRQALVRCSVHKDSPHLPAQYSNVPPKSQKFLESIISTHLHLVPPAEFAPPSPPLCQKYSCLAHIYCKLLLLQNDFLCCCLALVAHAHYTVIVKVSLL